VPSSSANPTLSTRTVPADGHHVAHPAVNEPDAMPFTLLANSGPAPVTYSLTFDNSGGSQSVRVYLKAFSSANSSETLWSYINVTLAASGNQKNRQTLVVEKSLIGAADTLWVGAWWDDGTYSTADTYFAAHPTGGGHHTVPILIG
jgi:hypothetical protein